MSTTSQTSGTYQAASSPTAHPAPTTQERQSKGRVLRIREHVRQLGAVETLRQAVQKRLISCRYASVDVSVIALALDRFEPRYLERQRRRPSRWVVQELQLGQLRELDVSAIARKPMARAVRWMERGDRVFAALEGERIVGYSLLTAQHYRDRDGLQVVVGPDSRKLRDMFVAEHRRRTVVPGLIHDAAMLAAKEAGAAWGIGSILRSNGAQLRNAIRGDWLEVERVRCRRLFQLTWSRTLWKAEEFGDGRSISLPPKQNRLQGVQS